MGGLYQLTYNFSEYPISPVLRLLLTDKTTHNSILFGTDSYAYLGDKYQEESHITIELLLGQNPLSIQPRVQKETAEQLDRTKKNAEVMTPSWIVNKMNNHCDEEWFGYSEVFNQEHENTWVALITPVVFPPEKTWMQYVDSRRLEITCGEAPYIVSRYDTTTGAFIPIDKRIGILDRKLRIINENTSTREEWMKWTIRAYQSVYGYEYQGDNLLLARINLLFSFVDYMEQRWQTRPTNTELRIIANIIAWNIWQMDGLTGTVPYSIKEITVAQNMLFDSFGTGTKSTKKTNGTPCRIYDWRSKESMEYKSLKGYILG